MGASAALFEEECFADWFLALPRVYDYAEEWQSLEEASEKQLKGRALDNLLEKCCREIFPPLLEQISRRLLLTADLVRESGGERDLVEHILAVALSLSVSGFPCHCHPFLRRLALESLQMARESLGEGYDPRLYAEDDEW